MTPLPARVADRPTIETVAAQLVADIFHAYRVRHESQNRIICMVADTLRGREQGLLDQLAAVQQELEKAVRLLTLPCGPCREQQAETARLQQERDAYKRVVADGCEDNNAIRNLVRPVLGEQATDGDSHGVPTPVDLVDALVARCAALTAALEKYGKHQFGCHRWVTNDRLALKEYGCVEPSCTKQNCLGCICGLDAALDAARGT